MTAKRAVLGVDVGGANLKAAQAKLANIKRYALTGLPGGPKK